MFLDLIDHLDHLASTNKFVTFVLLIQSLSQLIYFLHLFILILLLTYSHTLPFSLLHCLVFIRTIDPIAFSADILSSSLYTDPPSDLQSYSTLFSSTLSSLLDKHASLKTISCNSKPNKPFITPEILREKTKRSKLETIYRRSKTDQNKTNFKN